MLTRCPQCETLFPLGGEELEAGEGRVRCSHCKSLFFALEHLKKDDGDDPANGTPPELVAELQLGPDTLDRHEAERQQPFVEIPLVLQGRQEPPSTRFVWWILILLLMIVLVAQLAWLERRTLLANPQVSELLEMACERLGCRLPPRRAVDKIQILHRELVALQEVSEGLRFRLTLLNQASFEQPLPHLQLELLDRRQQSVGKRIFTPGEYLSPIVQADPLAPGQSFDIQLKLLDPGPDTTGFEINLL